MKSSTYKLIVITLMVSLLGLVGCQKRDRKTPTARATQGVNPDLTDPNRQQVTTGSCTASGNSSLNGFVYVDPVDAHLFEPAVFDFLTGLGHPDGEMGFGNIDGQCSSTAKTGIRFVGDVEFQNGEKLNVSGDTFANVASTSNVVVVVFDSTSIEQNIAGIGISGADAYGDINGKQVELTFRWGPNGDNFILMDGTINGDVFEGVFSFDNGIDYTDESKDLGRAGQVGRFKVPACGFFRCN